MKDYEISILKWFRSFSSPALDALFRCITFLGEQYFIIVIIMVAYFLLDKKQVKELFLLWLQQSA